MNDHDHEHGHDHGHGGRLAAWWHRLTHAVVPHSHDSRAKIDPALESSREGLRALWISLVGLGVTAAAQAVIVVLSGSVALLGDTLHNVADALTAVPLAIAFLLGRRAATRAYTYGFGRAEDIAGIVVVIAGSAVAAGWTAACSPSNATAPPPATRSSKAIPTTPAGRRAVALDKRTVQVLRAHRRRQLDQRTQAAENAKPWTDSGYVFVRADGLPINPNYATTRFRKTRPTRRATPGAAARPAPRRRVPRPRSRRRPQDPAGPARPLQHRHHRRHLHQRPTPGTAALRRRHRPPRPGRRPPHPQKDQEQGPQEPARPPAENRCPHPGHSRSRRKDTGQDSGPPRKSRADPGTHIAPT